MKAFDRLATATEANLRFALAGIFLLGILGAWGSSHIALELLRGAAEDVCGALVTTAVLGFTVDQFFKRQFAKDVFSAAFRYVLPEELKDEARRIFEYRAISKTSHISIKLEETETPEVVRLTFAIERTLTNISRERLPVTNRLAIDEWRLGKEKSAILRCDLRIDDQAAHIGKSCPANKDHPLVISWQTEEVRLAPEETATLVSSAVEYRRAPGEFYLHFSWPSVDPQVRLTVPDSLEYSCDFSLPNANKEKSEIEDVWTMHGTLFPGQLIRISWWPKNG